MNPNCESIRSDLHSLLTTMLENNKEADGAEVKYPQEYEKLVTTEITAMKNTIAKVAAEFKTIKEERKKKAKEVVDFLDNEQRDFFDSLPDYNAYMEEVSEYADMLDCLNNEQTVLKRKELNRIKKLSIKVDMAFKIFQSRLK